MNIHHRSFSSLRLIILLATLFAALTLVPQAQAKERALPDELCERHGNTIFASADYPAANITAKVGHANWVVGQHYLVDSWTVTIDAVQYTVEVWLHIKAQLGPDQYLIREYYSIPACDCPNPFGCFEVPAREPIFVWYPLCDPLRITRMSAYDLSCSVPGGDPAEFSQPPREQEADPPAPSSQPQPSDDPAAAAGAFAVLAASAVILGEAPIPTIP